MCTCLAWSGELPVGLLSNLLVAAMCRGKDGTGIAFREYGEKPQTVSYRQSYSARTFVKAHQDELRRARKSKFGLGHTRRASLAMKVDAHNAHPFLFGKTFYIHNGLIRNWKSIDPTVTTDTMVLGPTLDAYAKRGAGGELDLFKFEGIMALAWLRGDNLQCVKVNQDLTSVVLEWTPDGETTPRKSCVVVSKFEIFEEATRHIKVSCEYVEIELAEGVVYNITPDGPVKIGEAKINPACYTTPDKEALRTRISTDDDEAIEAAIRDSGDTPGQIGMGLAARIKKRYDASLNSIRQHLHHP